MKSKIFVLILAIFCVPAWSAVQTLSAKGGLVEILALGRPSFVKIQGTGSAPTGQIYLDGDKVKGEFEFDLGSLDTGIQMRNEHMKNKYLEVERYPKAQLVIQSVNSPSGWSIQKPKISAAEFEGQLTLHGVTSPVKGTFSMGDDRDVSAEFNVKLSDFQVVVPSFAGITVKDEVAIKVKIKQMALL